MSRPSMGHAGCIRLNFRARRSITTLMSRTLRLQLVFLLAALAIGGAVWLTATAQRSTATARAHRLADAQQLEDTTPYQEPQAGPSKEAPAPPPPGVPPQEGGPRGRSGPPPPG